MISLLKVLSEGPTEEIEQPYGKGKIRYAPKMQYKKGDIFTFTLIYVSGKMIEKKAKILHIERQSHRGPYTLWVYDPHFISEERPVDDPDSRKVVGSRVVKEIKQERILTNIRTSIQ